MLFRSNGIRVHFMRAGALFGETVPRVDRQTGTIVQAEVAIAGDTRGESLESQIEVYLTALHELGHALGLAHTDQFADIMYRFQAPDDATRYFARYRARVKTPSDIGTPRASGLSPDDTRRLRSLYGR